MLKTQSHQPGEGKRDPCPGQVAFRFFSLRGNQEASTPALLCLCCPHVAKWRHGTTAAREDELPKTSLIDSSSLALKGPEFVPLVNVLLPQQQEPGWSAGNSYLHRMLKGWLWTLEGGAERREPADSGNTPWEVRIDKGEIKAWETGKTVVFKTIQSA